MRFWSKVMLKTRLHGIFGPFVGSKTVNNFWTKKDIKNRLQGIGEKTTEDWKCARFEDQGINNLNVKRKRKLRKWVQRNCQFFWYNLCRRYPMQPCNFDGILYQLRHWILSHGSHQKIRFLTGTVSSRQKVIFVKSPISSPIVMP